MELKKRLKACKYALQRKKAYKNLIKEEVKGTRQILENDLTDLKKYLALDAHGIEKGAGIRNSKKGYGISRADRMLDNIDKYFLNNGNPQEWCVKEAISVFCAYIVYQENDGIDVSLLKTKFQMLMKKHPQIVNIEKTPLAGGFRELRKQDCLVQDIEKESIISAMEKRHSIRFYKKTMLSTGTITEILELAQNAPSACNRQVVNIWYSLEKEKNDIIDECVPGNGSFKNEIPYYFVVAADKYAFVDNELFQWYVNGGIYIGYLTMAIHAFGLGSIVFQWPNCCKDELKIRKVTGIPDEYAIVAIVGFGEMDDEIKAICASRKNVEEIAHIF